MAMPGGNGGPEQRFQTGQRGLAAINGVQRATAHDPLPTLLAASVGRLFTVEAGYNSWIY